MKFPPDQRAAFGARMRLARDAHGWSRQELCDLMELNDPCSPQRLANYETGERAPTSVEMVWELERALRLDPGRLSQHLGFMPPDEDAIIPDVEDALAQDRRLTPEDRTTLVTAYRELLAASEGG